mgnify:FL=1
MSTPPVIHNLDIYKGADWGFSYIFSSEASDGTVTPTDLTGGQILAQAWDEERDFKYADFGVTYIDRQNGSFSLSLTDEQTVHFPEKLNYDIVFVSSGGQKEPYIKGEINCFILYSRD